MFKITYTKKNSIRSAEFKDYLDLVEFVAEEMINDNDLVSLDLGDRHIDGLAGLAAYALQSVAAMRFVREMAQAEEECCEDCVEKEYDEEDTFDGPAKEVYMPRHARHDLDDEIHNEIFEWDF